MLILPKNWTGVYTQTLEIRQVYYSARGREEHSKHILPSSP